MQLRVNHGPMGNASWMPRPGEGSWCRQRGGQSCPWQRRRQEGRCSAKGCAEERGKAKANTWQGARQQWRRSLRPAGCRAGFLDSRALPPLPWPHRQRRGQEQRWRWCKRKAATAKAAGGAKGLAATQPTEQAHSGDKIVTLVGTKRQATVVRPDTGEEAVVVAVCANCHRSAGHSA